MKIKWGNVFFKLVLTYAAGYLFMHHEAWADTCSYSSEDPLHFQKQDCGERKDSYWDCALARCVVTAEAKEMEEAAANCEGLSEDEKLNESTCVQTAIELTESQEEIKVDQSAVKQNWF